MCAKKACLVLKLDGPMQAWGVNSQFSRRNTDLMPTKSAIAGIICASLGFERGSEAEKEILGDFANIFMLALAYPKEHRYNKEKHLDILRITDFHTVEGTKRAKDKSSSSKLNEHAVLTYRQYLQDALFYVFLSGDCDLMYKLQVAVKNPKWLIYLGRKSCVPSSPIYADLFNNQEEAVKKILHGKNINKFTHVRDIEEGESGHDSVNDKAINFASMQREFTLRRVYKHVGR